MSKSVTALLLSILVLAARSEAGETIEGTVQNANGAMLAGANVQVRGTGRGEATDGKFRIAGLAATKVQVVVSLIGYGSQTQTVDLRSGSERIAFRANTPTDRDESPRDLRECDRRRG